jgi:hypothetical protein
MLGGWWVGIFVIFYIVTIVYCLELVGQDRNRHLADNEFKDKLGGNYLALRRL